MFPCFEGTPPLMVLQSLKIAHWPYGMGKWACGDQSPWAVFGGALCPTPLPLGLIMDCIQALTKLPSSSLNSLYETFYISCMEKADCFSPSGLASHSHLACMKKTSDPCFHFSWTGRKGQQMRDLCNCDRCLYPSWAKSLTSGHQDWFALVHILCWFC